MTLQGGLVKRFNVISADSGGLVGPVKAGDNFGGGGIVALVKREDSEQGVVTLAVGAWSDNSSVDRGGSVYILTCKLSNNRNPSTWVVVVGGGGGGGGGGGRGGGGRRVSGKSGSSMFWVIFLVLLQALWYVD